MPKTLADLRPDDFEPHKGESFILAAGNGELALTLVSVERLGAALREGGAFSLTLTTPMAPVAPQAIYPLTHPALGTIEMFVVPLGPKDGVNRYEVIFT